LTTTFECEECDAIENVFFHWSEFTGLCSVRRLALIGGEATAIDSRQFVEAQAVQGVLRVQLDRIGKLY
jgi:hypothetical protein